MKKALVAGVVLCLGIAVAVPAVAKEGEKEEDRLEECGQVLKEVLDVPEDIPQDLLDKAECVVIVPSTKKLAIGIGGSYGRGAMSCRTGSNFTGPWSPPALYALEGGSIGFQLGGQETDFVLLIMNPRGVSSLLRSKVKIGADASAAAGPKGRNATADTDVALRAEILTYSRSRGLFAGISLAGSTLRQDSTANLRVYQKDVSARDIVRKGVVKTPQAGQLMVDVLNKRSPKNLSDPNSLKE
ncbi:MAG: lipid-binding SYLF domain-containing protein [Acidobacteriia bacterium]|nr:lipid-binding SYLF domain-containing protein [Terriglobia bacterium]